MVIANGLQYFLVSNDPGVQLTQLRMSPHSARGSSHIPKPGPGWVGGERRSPSQTIVLGLVHRPTLLAAVWGPFGFDPSKSLGPAASPPPDEPVTCSRPRMETGMRTRLPAPRTKHFDVQTVWVSSDRGPRTRRRAAWLRRAPAGAAAIYRAVGDRGASDVTRRIGSASNSWRPGNSGPGRLLRCRSSPEIPSVWHSARMSCSRPVPVWQHHGYRPDPPRTEDAPRPDMQDRLVAQWEQDFAWEARRPHAGLHDGNRSHTSLQWSVSAAKARARRRPTRSLR